ncbi:hypothetical protein HA466_0194660 [Hirschfeldia incana]|nr:hypothetical protein HA466_0194660 [Hirschfeldia incana]
MLTSFSAASAHDVPSAAHFLPPLLTSANNHCICLLSESKPNRLHRRGQTALPLPRSTTVTVLLAPPYRCFNSRQCRHVLLLFFFLT